MMQGAGKNLDALLHVHVLLWKL